MKKTIFLLGLLFLVILICIYMNYKELLNNQTQAQKFNAEFEFYNRESILGTDITTVINKAINQNEKNHIPKDENGLYLENEENSIKIYVHMLINETTYPMESLKKTGLNEFTKFFGEVEFRCMDIKYHKTTGQIAQMTFVATQV